MAGPIRRRPRAAQGCGRSAHWSRCTGLRAGVGDDRVVRRRGGEEEKYVGMRTWMASISSHANISDPKRESLDADLQFLCSYHEFLNGSSISSWVQNIK